MLLYPEFLKEVLKYFILDYLLEITCLIPEKTITLFMYIDEIKNDWY